LHRHKAPSFHLSFPRISILASLFRQSWPLLLANLSVILYMKLDQIMLKLMVGDTEAGLYFAALRLSELWYFVPMIVCSSVLPALLKMREIDIEKYTERLQLLYDGLYYFALTVAATTTLFAEPMIFLFLGEAYRSAIPVLQIHIWSLIPVFLGVASSQWLLAEKYQALSLVRTLIGLLVNLGLNLQLIPLYGALGAAFATTFAYLVATFAGLLLTKKTRPAFVLLWRTVFFHRLWPRAQSSVFDGR
jgi:O-antigen/teichoic acid export membrane protein